jgi:hypothetical protein
MQATVPILKEVQVFDQQVALPRPIAEKRAHVVLRLRIDLATFREFARPTAPGTWVNAARRLRAIRFAAWWMMNVHNLSMASAKSTLRHARPVPRSGGEIEDRDRHNDADRVPSSVLRATDMPRGA